MGFCLFFSLLTATRLYASNDWLCTQEASQIKDNNLLACGIGEGKDENEARTKAFEHAKAEFDRICKSSDTCRRRSVSVEPKRTSCESNKSEFKCYRLIIFSLSAELKNKPEQSAELKDTPDTFQPFDYESTSKLPKLVKGMSKKDLLNSFGAPENVTDLQVFDHKTTRLMFYYNGKMCAFSNCYVVVENGKVLEWKDFKPIYTQDLN